MKCPSCGHSLAANATECDGCGLVLAKFRPRTESQRLRTAPPRKSRPPISGGALILLLVAVAILVVSIVVGWRWARSTWKRVADGGSLMESGTLEMQRSDLPDFDVDLTLPGSPMGLASNGREIIVGNRKDPWGLIRLRPKKDRFVAEFVPLLEPRYQQKMQVNTLTWNGRNYVGLTSAAWFGKKTNDVFTIHDPNTLQVIRHHDAPPLLGCLAWDGMSYWAATRKNTDLAEEEKFLYQLDRDFNVTAKFTPPAGGCQGLMWDGARLWFVDVFNDSVYLIDVSRGEPSLVHTANLPLNYLSGVVLHNGRVWIAQYDSDRLHRVRSETQRAWIGGQDEVETIAASAMTPSTSSDPDEDRLRAGLRSDEWPERMRARMELDKRGAAIDYARDQNNFVDRAPEDTEDIDWSIELRDGTLWLASSHIWFGPDLFIKREQTSALVTVPVFAKYTYTVEFPDGSETEKEFEARPGENVLANVRLADSAASGKYSVSLFIHVQYVDAQGTARILNNSAGFLEVRQ